MPAERVLLTAADTRRLASELGVTPTKRHGQNFVIEPNLIRRIVTLAEVQPDEPVLEVGPGLGALTLGLLQAGAQVCAVELDPALADALPKTVAARLPEASARLHVVPGDARRAELPVAPTALAANLPYYVAVPLLLDLLDRLPSLQRGVVMVQAEVAERLTAAPGSRVYGVPSVKLAWYATARVAAPVARSVFWPQPNVDSALVAWRRREAPALGSESLRRAVFAAVDAAFSQRRKTLRAALADWAGSADAAAQLLLAAGIDPRRRGETLALDEFVRLAQAARAG